MILDRIGVETFDYSCRCVLKPSPSAYPAQSSSLSWYTPPAIYVTKVVTRFTRNVEINLTGQLDEDLLIPKL